MRNPLLLLLHHAAIMPLRAVKVKHNGTIRRFTYNDYNSYILYEFEQFVRTVRERFDLPSEQGQLEFKWVDTEGDLITVVRCIVLSNFGLLDLS